MGRRVHSAAGGAGWWVRWAGATPSRCSAALGVVWAVAFFLVPRRPRGEPKLNQAERDLLRAQAGKAVAHVGISWRKLLGSRAVWLLCWQYFFLSYGWYFYITWLPTYLRQGRHMNIGQSAWLGVLPLFFGGIGNMAGVFLGARLARATGNVPRARR